MKLLVMLGKILLMIATPGKPFQSCGEVTLRECTRASGKKNPTHQAVLPGSASKDFKRDVQQVSHTRKCGKMKRIAWFPSTRA